MTALCSLNIKIENKIEIIFKKSFRIWVSILQLPIKLPQEVHASF